MASLRLGCLNGTICDCSVTLGILRARCEPEHDKDVEIMKPLIKNRKGKKLVVTRIQPVYTSPLRLHESLYCGVSTVLSFPVF